MNNLKFDNVNTIVNFSNSLLKYFGAPTHHNTIPEVDKALEGHKKVVVMLFDGLGRAIRREHLKDDSALNGNYLHTMLATYPPTTVASTNGGLSGQFPIENGWYGWRQYYDDLGCNILVFKSLDPDSGKYYQSPCGNLHREKYGYKTIVEQIKAANPNVDTGSIFPKPIDKKGPVFLRGFERRLNKYLKDKEQCFLYLYDTQPDTTLHYFGVHSRTAHRLINRIDKFVARAAKKNKDTLFLIIADHGLVNVETISVFEHQDLVDTFIHQPSLEGRTCTFFIKDKDKETFVTLFNKYYSGKFILLTKEEALNMHMFGEGKVNEESLKFIGDYIAVAIDKYHFDLCLEFNKRSVFAAHHAGYTKEEMEIDISALNA